MVTRRMAHPPTIIPHRRQHGPCGTRNGVLEGAHGKEGRHGSQAARSGCLASHGFRIIPQIWNCWMINDDLWENICAASIFFSPTHGYLVRAALFLLQHHVQALQILHGEIPKGNHLRFSLLRSNSVVLCSVDLPNLQTWHVPSLPLAQTKERTNWWLWSFTVKALFKL